MGPLWVPSGDHDQTWLDFGVPDLKKPTQIAWHWLIKHHEKEITSWSIIEKEIKSLTESLSVDFSWSHQRFPSIAGLVFSFYLAQAGHSGLFPHVPCSACFRQPGDDFQVGPGIDMPHIPSPTHEDVDQWHQARWPWACEGCTTAQSSSIIINLYPCAVCMMSLVHSSLNRCWCFIFFIVIEEW